MAAEWTGWVTPSEAVDSHCGDDFVWATRLRRSASPGEVDRHWTVDMAQSPTLESRFGLSEFENASGIPDRRAQGDDIRFTESPGFSAGLH
jgi:hypothetical protein